MLLAEHGHLGQLGLIREMWHHYISTFIIYFCISAFGGRMNGWTLSEAVFLLSDLCHLNTTYINFLQMLQ